METTTNWLASSSMYPPLNEGWELSPQADDMFRGQLEYEMPFPPPLSPDGGLIHPALITPPLDQDIWDMIQGETSSARPDASVDGNDTAFQPYQHSRSTSRTTAHAAALHPDGDLPSPPPQQEIPRFVDSTNPILSLSSLSSSKSKEGSTCPCLKTLTDHLCQLNILERRNAFTRLDITLSRTREVLLCSEDVLACHFCRLDTRLMVLLARLLQTVFTWAKVGYHHQGAMQDQSLLPVYLGEWKVAEEDGRLVKAILTGRLLSGGNSLISALRVRLDEVVQVARRQNIKYQVLHVDELQHTLQRLTGLLRELSQYVRLSMHT
ncbi:hypothetical protein VM1G_06145 [Cytospora mali]|uniref:Aflatoxin regulatory protein domain-containing protein n=1 Tax=Cytospora mali TaxID=578113 RepID=A0A194W1Y7_CYTMA|nr:hypothetical protein VM1G_06145 [Valsa mali]